MSLENVWHLREVEVYPSLFGDNPDDIYPLPMEMFTGQFRQRDIDPRWLHHGVLEYRPTATRKSWLYVTSGHSNPWNKSPEDYDVNADSGAGIEFTLATTEPGDWAIRTLQAMLAFDILLLAGRFPGSESLAVGDRIPLRTPLNDSPSCVLRNLIVTDAEDVQNEFQLPSGKVSLLGFTAISDEELEVAKRLGSEHVIELLRAAGHHPVNNPHRLSMSPIP